MIMMIMMMMIMATRGIFSILMKKNQINYLLEYQIMIIQMKLKIF